MNITARLGGGKSGDPSLLIDLVDRRRALMFDCGLNYFQHASLRKVSDVFISHTHIDHFIGFDTLLRLNLTENKTLHVYGPPGITQNVIGKLQGYTWNICQNLTLIIVVHEIQPQQIIVTELESCRGFAIRQISQAERTATLLMTEDFSVACLELDHKTPSFGFSLREADSCNVQKDAMQALNLEPGPWVATLKARAFDPASQEMPFQIGETCYTVGFLAEKLLVRKTGIKISYLTDFLFVEALLEQIQEFAWHSDFLFCEASFSEREQAKAKLTHHLTAKEAGLLARVAQVKQLILFHFSRRYQDYSLLLDEARHEFANVE